jgi:thioredoxin-related protein
VTISTRRLILTRSIPFICVHLWLACFSFAAQAAEPSPHAIDLPKWFSLSLLDFREDVKEAAAQGKRVAVYFGQDGCPYCKRLMDANFSQRDIVEATRKRFNVVALNLWGDRETKWIDGEARTEKALGAMLRVQFTPTLLFLDESGEVVMRLNGYQPPARFRAALEHASAAKPGGESFAEYLQRKPVKEASLSPAEAGLLRDPPLRVWRRREVPTLFVFESRDCEPCAELHAALRSPEVRALAKSLDAARIDAFGARAVTLASGTTLTEAQFARSLGIAFTPALVFLGDEGREVFRVEGYLRPFHLASALDYVASGDYKREPSFQRFIQARAERERAAGRRVELW